MGKVTVFATVENLDDLTDERVGRITADKIRRVEIGDALIDSGATCLLMPKRFIDQLGLAPVKKRTAKTVEMQTYRAARLTIQGCDCISDVTEIADDLPVLIGQVPLELMDWVIDRRNQKLIGNPAHGGEQMIEVY